MTQHGDVHPTLVANAERWRRLRKVFAIYAVISFFISFMVAEDRLGIHESFMPPGIDPAVFWIMIVLAALGYSYLHNEVIILVARRFVPSIITQSSGRIALVLSALALAVAVIALLPVGWAAFSAATRPNLSMTIFVFMALNSVCYMFNVLQAVRWAFGEPWDGKRKPKHPS